MTEFNVVIYVLNLIINHQISYYRVKHIYVV